MLIELVAAFNTTSGSSMSSAWEKKTVIINPNQVAAIVPMPKDPNFPFDQNGVWSQLFLGTVSAFFIVEGAPSDVRSDLGLG